MQKRIILLIILLRIMSGSSANSHPPLRIVGDQNNMPFSFLDQHGTPQGLTIDIWNLWSDKTGFPVNYQLDSINNIYQSVLTDRADVIGGIVPTAEYTNLFDFSISYTNLDYIIFYHKKLDNIKTLNDLIPYRVGVISGDYAELFIKQNKPELSMVSYNDAPQLVEQFYHGGILVFVGNIPEMMFHLARTGAAKQLKQTTYPLASLHMCAAVKKGNHRLLDKINNGLASISLKEFYDIQHQWYKTSSMHKTSWSLIILAAVLMVGFIIGFIYWYRHYQLGKQSAAASGDTDIQQRQLQESEEALRQNEEKYRVLYAESKRAEDLYRSLLNSSPDAIILYDNFSSPVFVNPSFKRIFGWDVYEFNQDNIHFVPESEQEKNNEVISSLMNRDNSYCEYYTKRLTKDGRCIDVSLKASMYYDHENNPLGLLMVIRDVSETKKLEFQLRQAHKQEVFNTFARGFAHDFNNMMSTIIGYTEIALRETEENHRLYPYLQQIITACDKAVEFIHQRLSFSRQDEVEYQPVSIGLSIKEALKLIRSSLPSTIEIQQHIEDEDSIVNGLPAQIQQVLTNLCANANHAMGEKGGILAIRLEKVQLTPENFLLPEGIKPGTYTHLTVSDTGHGMDADTMERIFDPYFTTKHKGKQGIGLGLAIVQGIVKAHGGFVTVNSQRGEGSSFHVYLPIQEASQPLPPVETMEKEPPAEGKERILFIDDEETIVEIGKEILTHFGYEVITSTNSASALDLFKKDPYYFDAIVSDLTMPNINGEKLSQMIHELRTDIPIIICTGYSDAIDKNKATEIGIGDIMIKPVNYKELAQKIRNTMDSKKQKS